MTYFTGLGVSVLMSSISARAAAGVTCESTTTTSSALTITTELLPVLIAPLPLAA